MATVGAGIYIKTPAELERMRRAGQVAARALAAVGQAVRPGITTGELDAVAEEAIRAEGGVPSFLGYRGFPASACVSVNDEIVHGIPGRRVLREGDVVKVDLGVYLDGFHGDLAATFPVGRIDPGLRRLLGVTEEALYRAIDVVRPGARLGDIGWTIQSFVESHGYSVVREFAGHGVGRFLHEDPQVPNFGTRGRGLVLRPGIVLAIEPMVNAGTWRARVDGDGWTVRTADGRPSAHFEHTVAVTEGGCEVLTRLDEEVGS
ncbi:MAG: type I methionyl aminopeptidase [Armatimonadota bacterium]|nr:type I methionyl aminopeptidase [Armatimonadota bacterium]MDR5697105.1 type I methionyl aminopeptidase [Armatimonadota bacterium]